VRKAEGGMMDLLMEVDENEMTPVRRRRDLE
jgi:hypothetical protein